MKSSLNNWHQAAAAGLILACALPAAASLDTPSSLNPSSAAALIVAGAMGEKLPGELTLELAKFVRDIDQDKTAAAAQSKSQLNAALSRSVVSLGLRNRRPLDATRFGIVPFAPGTTLQQVYSVLGQVNTISWLTAATVLPDLAPFALPHNQRQIGTYSASASATVLSGAPFGSTTRNVTVGQSFVSTATLDADLLTVAGIDQNLISDTIVVQTPLSASLSDTYTCTKVSTPATGSRCLAVSHVAGAPVANDKVLATNTSYRFAYPLFAGEFATRLTASDALMAAYDQLGKLHSQKPRDPLTSSPFVMLPGFEDLVPGTGLADLGTQAPPVNFYGLQSTSDAALADAVVLKLLSPALATLRLGSIDLRLHKPVPPRPIFNTGLSLQRQRIGPTAGYRAAELRAQQINLLFVRWHNLGKTTAVELADNELREINANLALPPPLATMLQSSPATFYYDVPAGQYALSDKRVDSQGGVYVVDYQMAASAPDLKIPPTLPRP